MKYFIFSLVLLSFINGCSSNPEPATDEENDVKAKISQNRTEALHAKEEYKRLKQTREQ
jgi:hypothetical protein